MDLKKEILKMLKEIENTKNLESIHIVTRTALKKEIKKKIDYAM